MKVREIVILLFLLMTAGCSRMFVFLQRDPYVKEERKRFSQEELYVIDGRLYLKATDKETGKMTYVEIREYLKQPERWELKSQRETKVEYGEGTGEFRWARGEEGSSVGLRLPKAPPFLKRKLALLPLKGFGAEAGMYDVADAFQGFLLERSLLGFPVPWESLRAFLEKSGLGTPREVGRDLVLLLGKGLGVQYVLALETCGPFRSGKEVLFSMGIKGYETLQGYLVLDLWIQKKAQSPTEVFEIAFEEALTKLEEFLENSGWFTRVVGTKGKEAMLLAGRKSGLGEGDLFSILDPLKGERKGRVRVKSLLGDDLCIISQTEGTLLGDNDLAFFEPEEKG